MPGPLAVVGPEFAERRADPLPQALRARRRRPPAPAAGSRSTASSTRPTSGSTAPTSAIPRATSSRTASTSRALSRLGDDHVLAVEVTCNPERGTTGRRNITGLFQHSEAVDRDWNPGGIWRAGARLRHRPGQARPAARAVPRRRRHPRPPPPARPARQRRRPHGAPAHVGRRRRRRRDRAPARRRRQRDRVVARRRPTAAVVAARARRPAAHRHRRRGARRRRGQRPPLAPHRAARGGVERLGVLDQRRAAVPEGRQPAARRGPGSPTPRRPTCAATSSWRSRPGSTCCACRPTSPTTSCTAPPTSSACCCCRTSRCSGATPARSAGRRCARPARPSTRSATTRRSCSGAPTTSRSPRRRRSRPTAARRRLRRFVAQQLPSWNKSVLDRWVKRSFEQADPTRPTVAHGGVAPAPAAARRHRLAHVARLAPRRRRRARRAGPADPPPRALRQRVRGPVGARRRRALRRHVALARARLGRAARAPRPRGRGDDWSGCRPPITRRSARGARRRSATRR